MTDWYTILEYIERATEASEKFQEAGEALINHTREDEIRAFAEKLEALHTELSTIYKVIGPGSPVALDELAEAFSQAMRGKHAEYRMTPEVQSDR
jgi:hypothetical protein